MKQSVSNDIFSSVPRKCGSINREQSNTICTNEQPGFGNGSETWSQWRVSVYVRSPAAVTVVRSNLFVFPNKTHPSLQPSVKHETIYTTTRCFYNHLPWLDFPSFSLFYSKWPVLNNHAFRTKYGNNILPFNGNSWRFTEIILDKQASLIKCLNLVFKHKPYHPLSWECTLCLLKPLTMNRSLSFHRMVPYTLCVHERATSIFNT